MATNHSAFGLLRIVFEGLLAALIGLVIFGVVLGKVVPLTGRQTLIIGGASMTPAIPLGSAAVLAPDRQTPPQVGDVISLKLPTGTIFTHRVVEVITRDGATWYRTKGDANANPDAAIVPSSWVLGRVEFSVPFAGFLLRLLSLPSGIIMLACLAGSLLVGSWLADSLEADESAPESVTPRVSATSPG